MVENQRRDPPDLIRRMVEDLRRRMSMSRVYAPMREGGSKTEKELDVVCDLLAEMKRRGEEKYFDPQLSPQDPPDIIARTADGEAVAVEVTELVCQDAIEANQWADREAIKRFEPGAAKVRIWQRVDFLQHVAGLLSSKDAKQLHGGPFARYLLVIHTDEPELETTDSEKWLTSHVFGPFKQLDEAYLLCQYAAGEDRYPYQKIALAVKQGVF